MNTQIPTSIGIIMDGNRRFAKAKGLPTLEGHRAGYEKMREVIGWCKDSGVRNLIVYAFSTENWNRAEEEVSYLMDLFRMVIETIVEEAKKDDTRVIFLGERTRLPQDILKRMKWAEEETASFTTFTLGIALSYGGRAEIVDAIRRIPKESLETISEEEFSDLLWTKDIPDPDLIIRTSGERRLSNFLPWQSVYSELFFIDSMWPDFTREEFERILKEYEARERRRGK